MNQGYLLRRFGLGFLFRRTIGENDKEHTEEQEDRIAYKEEQSCFTYQLTGGEGLQGKDQVDEIPNSHSDGSYVTGFMAPPEEGQEEDGNCQAYTLPHHGELRD